VATQTKATRGKTSERVKATRGSAGGHRVTPARPERTLWMRKSSKSQADDTHTWRARISATQNGKEDRFRRKAGPATGEGKPLKVKAQGRDRHETRPEGLRAEQRVKRLRKPEGAAQPGEASPVQVAARF